MRRSSPVTPIWLAAALTLVPLGSQAAPPPGLYVDHLHRRPPAMGARPTILADGLEQATGLLPFDGAWWVSLSSGEVRRYTPAGAHETVATALPDGVRLVTDGQHLLLETPAALSWWVPSEAGGRFEPVLSGRSGLHATHVFEGVVYWMEGEGGGTLFEAPLTDALAPVARATSLGDIAAIQRRGTVLIITPSGPEPRGFQKLVDGEDAPRWIVRSRLRAQEMLVVGEDVWAVMMHSRGFIQRLTPEDRIERVCYAQTGSKRMRARHGAVFWYGPSAIWRVDGEARPAALVVNTSPVGLIVGEEALVWIDQPRGLLLTLPLADTPTSAVP